MNWDFSNSDVSSDALLPRVKNFGIFVNTQFKYLLLKYMHARDKTCNDSLHFIISNKLLSRYFYDMWNVAIIRFVT